MYNRYYLKSKSPYIREVHTIYSQKTIINENIWDWIGGYKNYHGFLISDLK